MGKYIKEIGRFLGCQRKPKKKKSGEEKQRVIHVSDQMFNQSFDYADNVISTGKYTVITFLPKNLFEQFQRIANAYFLGLLILQLIPQISSLTPITTVIPLVCVLSITALKDGIDDIRRHHNDNIVNNRESQVLRDGHIVDDKWRNVQVGDILRLSNDQFVAADLLLISTSEPNGLCYIETAELDGETNLKCRQALPETAILEDDHKQMETFNAEIICEPPNNRLNKFEGTITWKGKTLPLDNEKILLRGCVLRNTKWCYGVVLFAGNDTKLMQNSGKDIFKRTSIDHLVNVLIIGIFMFLLSICLFTAIGHGIWMGKIGVYFRIILPWESFIPTQPVLPGIIAISSLNFLSYLILLNTLVPISLYVSVEMIRIAHSFWINWDIKMYDSKSDTPARARTTTLNEELGQIQYIFSDKTGTLTQNIMTFKKCSILGKLFGYIKDDRGNLITPCETDKSVDLTSNPYHESKFRFQDASLVEALKRGDKDVKTFFTLLALCHTVMPGEKDGKLEYLAQSPDEGALVSAARNFGIVFKSRTPNTITIEDMGTEYTYELLAIFDFNNVRKRMSVLVRKDDIITLYCKGADNVVMERLDPGDDQELISTTLDHLTKFAVEGLRTLCLAYKVIDPNIYEEWQVRFQQTNACLVDRDAKLDELYEEMETNLHLLGATAIEDKLQDGVPQTIANLLRAGIRIWVLTGDKQETAINIGYSCQLLNDDVEEIYVIDGQEFDEVERELASIKATCAPNLFQPRHSDPNILSTTNAATTAAYMNNQRLSQSPSSYNSTCPMNVEKHETTNQNVANNALQTPYQHHVDFIQHLDEPSLPWWKKLLRFGKSKRMNSLHTTLTQSALSMSYDQWEDWNDRIRRNFYWLIAPPSYNYNYNYYTNNPIGSPPSLHDDNESKKTKKTTSSLIVSPLQQTSGGKISLPNDVQLHLVAGDPQHTAAVPVQCGAGPKRYSTSQIKTSYNNVLQQKGRTKQDSSGISYLVCNNTAFTQNNQPSSMMMMGDYRSQTTGKNENIFLKSSNPSSNITGSTMYGLSSDCNTNFTLNPNDKTNNVIGISTSKQQFQNQKHDVQHKKKRRHRRKHRTDTGSLAPTGLKQPEIESMKIDVRVSTPNAENTSQFPSNNVPPTNRFPAINKNGAVNKLGVDATDFKTGVGRKSPVSPYESRIRYVNKSPNPSLLNAANKGNKKPQSATPQTHQQQLKIEIPMSQAANSKKASHTANVLLNPENFAGENGNPNSSYNSAASVFTFENSSQQQSSHNNLNNNQHNNTKDNANIPISFDKNTEKHNKNDVNSNIQHAHEEDFNIEDSLTDDRTSTPSSQLDSDYCLRQTPTMFPPNNDLSNEIISHIHTDSNLKNNKDKKDVTDNGKNIRGEESFESAKNFGNNPPPQPNNPSIVYGGEGTHSAEPVMYSKPSIYALVISGHSLVHALDPKLEAEFIELGSRAMSVICCRVTPLQKAMVVDLVKRKKRVTTLAIGDGANDVSMIRRANIGIGISGLEGRQAVLASDFAIAQFRFLERLLLVHGRWSYYRMTKFLRYFFYKNFAFTLCSFWYGFFCGFSAQSLFDPWFISFYNLFYTSLPVLALAFFEQDVDEDMCIRYPQLYRASLGNKLFNKKIFAQSILHGIITSFILFIIPYFAFTDGMSSQGKETGLFVFGIAVSTCLIFTVSLQAGLDTAYWTGFNHFVIWGSIIFYLAMHFLMYSPLFNRTFVGVMLAATGQPKFWFTVVLTTAILILPVLAIRSYFCDTRPNLADRIRYAQRLYNASKRRKQQKESRALAAAATASNTETKDRFGFPFPFPSFPFFPVPPGHSYDLAGPTNGYGPPYYYNQAATTNSNKQRASQPKLTQRHSMRTGYAFAHQHGFGDLIIKGTSFRPLRSSLSALDEHIPINTAGAKNSINQTSSLPTGKSKPSEFSGIRPSNDNLVHEPYMREKKIKNLESTAYTQRESLPLQQRNQTYSAVIPQDSTIYTSYDGRMNKFKARKSDILHDRTTMSFFNTNNALNMRINPSTNTNDVDSCEMMTVSSMGQTDSNLAVPSTHHHRSRTGSNNSGLTYTAVPSNEIPEVKVLKYTKKNSIIHHIPNVRSSEPSKFVPMGDSTFNKLKQKEYTPSLQRDVRLHDYSKQEQSTSTNNNDSIFPDTGDSTKQPTTSAKKEPKYQVDMTDDGNMTTDL